jgi:hypothetical protein
VQTNGLASFRSDATVPAPANFLGQRLVFVGRRICEFRAREVNRSDMKVESTMVGASPTPSMITCGESSSGEALDGSSLHMYGCAGRTSAPRVSDECFRGRVWKRHRAGSSPK